KEVLERYAEGPEGLLGNTFLIHGAGTRGVLVARDAEENERFETQVNRLTDFLHQAIDAELVIARHRRDFLLDPSARPNKQRQNQIVNGEPSFANQIANERVVAKPAKANGRKPSLRGRGSGGGKRGSCLGG